MNDQNMREFIKKNKTEFEQEKPSSNLWDKIESQLPEEETKVRKMVPVKRLWQMASGLTAVFVLAVIALTYNGSNPGNNPTAGTHGGEMTPGQFTGVDQLEEYYSVQVNTKMEQLRKYEVDDELLEEIELLKGEFEELKSEAGTGVNQEEILDSMIDNYKLRVDILEDIMREVSRKSENKGRDVVQ